MKCKNCGADMLAGQLICSMCDFDNSQNTMEMTETVQQPVMDYKQNTQGMFTNPSNQVNNINNDVMFNNETTNNNSQISSNTNNSYVMEDDFMSVNTSSKKGTNKGGKGIILLILLVVTLIVLIPILIFGLGFKQTKKTVDSIQNSSFINLYQVIAKVTKSKMAENEDPSCSSNCSSKYEYDDIELNISKQSNYYRIEMKSTKDGKYKNVNLDSKDCSNIQDTVCSGNVIIGRAYFLD